MFKIDENWNKCHWDKLFLHIKNYFMGYLDYLAYYKGFILILKLLILIKFNKNVHGKLIHQLLSFW